MTRGVVGPEVGLDWKQRWIPDNLHDDMEKSRPDREAGPGSREEQEFQACREASPDQLHQKEF